MKKVAIVGYGNIGKFAIDAVKNSGDMKLVGLVRRSNTDPIPGHPDIKVVTDIEELGQVDVAILSTPSRAVRENAEKYLKMGINTVDSFDIHSDIYDLKEELDVIAKDNGVVSIVSSGWDPGSDSIMRALLLACAPKGETYTNFGPGMSMGHSTVVKNIKGVEDAVSVTVPLGTGIHRRMVYVKLSGTKPFEEVEKMIKEDEYFINDETHVREVADIDKYKDVGHGVKMEHRGISGDTHNQKFEFSMSVNNPALTSQLLCSAARATFNQQPGSYTLIEVPVIDLVEGDKETIIRELV